MDDSAERLGGIQLIDIVNWPKACGPFWCRFASQEQALRYFHNLPFMGRQPVTLITYMLDGASLSRHFPKQCVGFTGDVTCRQVWQAWRENMTAFVDEVDFAVPTFRDPQLKVIILPALTHDGRPANYSDKPIDCRMAVDMGNKLGRHAVEDWFRSLYMPR